MPRESFDECFKEGIADTIPIRKRKKMDESVVQYKDVQKWAAKWEKDHPDLVTTVEPKIITEYLGEQDYYASPVVKTNPRLPTYNGFPTTAPSTSPLRKVLTIEATGNGTAVGLKTSPYPVRIQYSSLNRNIDTHRKFSLGTWLLHLLSLVNWRIHIILFIIGLVLGFATWVPLTIMIPVGLVLIIIVLGFITLDWPSDL